jgi:hypothetical protein
MGFWNRFQGAPQEDGLRALPLPTAPIQIHKDIKPLSKEDSNQLITFWKEHFGSPPRTPTLLVNPKWIQADTQAGNFGFRLRGWRGVVYGRRIGVITLNRENSKIETYLIEGLTLKAEERQKGLTPLLLDACVAHLQQKLPTTRFLFLKEGKKAPTDVLASDTYMYRRLRIADKRAQKPLTPEKAKEIFLKLTAGSHESWLSNDFGLPNSRTNFYATKCEQALMAVTETHQVHHLDGQRLGLITGYVALKQSDAWPLAESPPFGTQTQSNHQEELLNAQPYGWIWSPSSYVSDPALWLQDGYVSWQPFLFTVKPQVKMANVFLAL